MPRVSADLWTMSVVGSKCGATNALPDAEYRDLTCALETDLPHEGMRAEPDGRNCHLCGYTDDSDDPVILALEKRQVPRAWGAKPRMNAKGRLLNQGNICRYCKRTWESRYKHKGYTTAKLVTYLGVTRKRTRYSSS